jgi:hypothetical protein
MSQHADADAEMRFHASSLNLLLVRMIECSISPLCIFWSSNRRRSNNTLRLRYQEQPQENAAVHSTADQCYKRP